MVRPPLPAVSLRNRALVVAVVLACLVPVAFAAVQYSEPAAAGNVSEDRPVTFISTQGTELGSGAKVVAIDTETREVLWANSSFRSYFDVDPIGDDRVLFAASVEYGQMQAFVINWRTGELVEQFWLPPNAHDVDYLGGDRYAIADKYDRALVYDIRRETIVWNYSFEGRFPPSDGGVRPGDWTHMNDIDRVGEDKFLVSPRNFDRVMLINQTTKSVVWTLGEEDNYSILYEQHNPTLLSRSPPTVLVADSENDRVVEYRKDGPEWERTWTYGGMFIWPRDADRMPNGNTLIVDSGGQRVVEVTPEGEMVWTHDILRNPYDAERLEHGDEPGGPPSHRMAENGTDVESVVREPQRSIPSKLWSEAYFLSSWVFPAWVGPREFTFVAAALAVGGGWLTVEVATVAPGWIGRLRSRLGV
ncbi:aryl-sulfate sulfotransferase [Halosimplex halophilum]|uniref:aryl-sulfate sulfotransferase n=1 Tax=Halosimplex halophilum TaxID=2559572 RepID=UPI00107F4A5B|nr:aryl-sulfate sulfotransferase [Halosimplex halophilum]